MNSETTCIDDNNKLAQITFIMMQYIMHFHKKSHISDNVIFVTNYILLTQFFTLHKNDVNFIKEFMKISRLFSQNLN